MGTGIGWGHCDRAETGTGHGHGGDKVRTGHGGRMAATGWGHGRARARTGVRIGHGGDIVTEQRQGQGMDMAETM